ncbi:MAG: beta-glucosidase [Firmicutes bacterium]|nr:beta-glucosidase [Bacillota bacterium]
MQKNDFYLGVATSALQIEGSLAADGSGQSLWEVFAAQPGKVFNNDTPALACDHYRRCEADLDLMAALGIEMYRFSTAWPRIFPAGAGALNQKGLDFYARLIDGLLERGIEPMLTLYHWELPQTMQERGGWANRDVAKYFADYAGTMLERFGDRVKYWITHNEPWVTTVLGYWEGVHPPGTKDFAVASQVAHHLLYSHQLVWRIFQELNLPQGQLGIALNLSPVHAASNQPADLAAADRYDAFLNRWFMDPVLKGTYPEALCTLWREQGVSYPLERMDELQAGTINFLGINYYTRNRVQAGSGDALYALLRLEQLPPELPATEMGWEIYPDGLYELLTRISRENKELPLFITENGAAFPDQVDADGRVKDEQRIAYLEAHLAQVRRAKEEGVNVRGYLVWSFLDNFEWTYGYSKRFGLVYVDYATQKRIIKDSGYWYRDQINRKKQKG